MTRASTRDRRALDVDIPFASATWPLVVAARARRPAPPAGVSAEALDDLDDELLRVLARTAGPALLSLFDPAVRDPASRVHYDRFVDHLVRTEWEEPRRAFPALGDLVDDVCDAWSTATAVMLDRIGSDVCRSGTGGIDQGVARILAGLGDRHRGGHAVARVDLTTGSSIVHKPRPMAAEVRFFDLVRWYRRRTDDDAPVPVIDDRGDYGWMEMVRPAPCTDPSAYWRRAGEISALLYAAGAEDLHDENLVVVGDQLVPLDLECIDQPDWRPGANSPRGLITGDGIAATGLLPGTFGRFGVVARDTAGLLSRPARTSGVWVRRWVGEGTDAIGLDREITGDRITASHPVDAHGALVDVDAEATIEGFVAGLEAVQADDCPLGRWASSPVRVLFRSTAVYSGRINALSMPATLADRATFDAVLGDMPELPSHLEERFGEAGVLALVASEFASLRRLDVPLFRAIDDDVELDDGTRLRGVVPETSIDRRRARLVRLSRGADAAQVQTLRIAIEQFRGDDHTVARPLMPDGEPVEVAPAALVEAALDLARRIADAGIETDDGTAWLELDRSSKQLQTLSGNVSLYGGSTGIALAFGALAAVTGADEWSHRARRALATAPEGQGLARWLESGWAGHAYVRSVLAEQLDDWGLADQAAAIVRERMQPVFLDRSSPLDVIGGWAGVLVAVLAVIDRTGADDLVPCARHLCDQIVEQVSQRSADPLRVTRLHKLGFAHGTTGVSWALARAADRLDDDAAAAAATALARHEDGRITDRGGYPGWRVRAGTGPVRSWCWGVSGYASARTDPTAALLDAPHLAMAIDALDSTERERTHLCCGEAGELVVLDAVARRTGDPRARRCADTRAVTLAAEARAGGPWSFYHQTGFVPPSLFWGLAGVSWSLIRVAAPASVPNVLTLD